MAGERIRHTGLRRNPETMERVALPSVVPGTESVPPPLADALEAGPAALATMVAAVPPEDGMPVAGLNAARLQLCSIGAKVKSPLSFWPVTMRPWT